MKNSSRGLPHINELYIQRQQHLNHKRKIAMIMKKKIKPKINYLADNSNSDRWKKMSTQVSLQQLKVTTRNPQLINIGHLPDSIPEFQSECKKQWMSPFRKRYQEQKTKQNQRLYLSIMRCKSQIRANKLQKQYNNIASIKKRICRYQVNSKSRVMLKSEKSLDFRPKRVQQVTARYLLPQKQRIKSQTRQISHNFRDNYLTKNAYRKQSNKTEISKRYSTSNNSMLGMKYFTKNSQYKEKLKPIASFSNDKIQENKSLNLRFSSQLAKKNLSKRQKAMEEEKRDTKKFNLFPTQIQTQQ